MAGEAIVQHCTRFTVLVVGALVLLAAATAGPLYGQEEEEKEQRKSMLYQWTDERGIPHITDNPAKVPKKFHSTVRTLEKIEDESVTPPTPESVPAAGIGARPLPHLEESDQFQRALWQARIREARERITAAERRLAELEKHKEDMLRLWGGPASGRTEGRVEAARLDSEIAGVQQELASARHELEVTIPSDARKAGIPPGWLRD